MKALNKKAAGWNTLEKKTNQKPVRHLEIVYEKDNTDLSVQDQEQLNNMPIFVLEEHIHYMFGKEKEYAIYILDKRRAKTELSKIEAKELEKKNKFSGHKASNLLSWSPEEDIERASVHRCYHMNNGKWEYDDAETSYMNSF
jgi:hypothetical protein